MTRQELKELQELIELKDKQIRILGHNIVTLMDRIAVIKRMQNPENILRVTYKKSEQ